MTIDGPADATVVTAAAAAAGMADTGRAPADDATGGSPALSHVDESGTARMVDVGDKAVTRRVARAGARVWMAPETMRLLQRAALPKGDVLAVARVAGIMAAKRTSELIPLCHPLALNQVEVDFAVDAEASRVEIEVTTRTDGKTGVEMEALTAAGVAALTIYDMCKAVDRGMVIGDIRLLEKTGGKEAYVRDMDAPAPGTLVAADPATGSGATTSAVAATSTGTTATAAATGPEAAPSPAGGAEALPAGVVLSVNVSPGKGERKKPVERVTLRTEHGIEGDGHAGPWHRQVSLLAQESIDTMRAKGLDVGPGDFAENITTRGVDVCSLPVGTRMRIGPALVELTQIGKICHDRCAIYYQAGDCVMPREGIFVRVLEGGEVAPGDPVVVVELGQGPTEPVGEATAVATTAAEAGAATPGEA